MPKLNEHPTPPKHFALEDLQKIKRGAEVLSSRGENIGQAIKLYQRLHDANQSLKLYEFYLECSRSEMGNSAYIPTDFLESISASGDRIELSVPLKVFLAEGWDITPDFIARSTGKKIQL